MQPGNSSASSGESSVTIKRKPGSNAGPSVVKVRDSSEARTSREQLLRESTSDDDLEETALSNDNLRAKQTGKRRKRKKDQEPLRQPSNRSMSKTLRVSVLFITLIIAVTTVWLFFDIRGQATSLRYQIEKVSAGTRDLPEQIQNCRSVNRQLNKDLTELSNRMNSINQKFDNFSVQIDQVQKALLDVQSKLHSYPELINVPNEMDELSKNVANFGSHLQDIQLKTNQLSDDRSTVISDLVSVKNNLSALQVSLDNIKNEAVVEKNKSKDLGNEKLIQLIDTQLKDKLNALNQSLTTRLNWTSVDQQNDHRTIGALQENFANLSSQLQTFTEDLTSLALNISSLNNQVTSFKTIIKEKTKSPITGQGTKKPSYETTNEKNDSS